MSISSQRWVSWSKTRFFFVAAETLKARSGENSGFSSILWYYVVFTNCTTIYIIMTRDDCIAYNISTGAWSTHSLMAAPREEAASAVVGFVLRGLGWCWCCWYSHWCWPCWHTLRASVDVEPRLGETCSSWEASLMATRASQWRWTDTEHQTFCQERYQQTIKQREISTNIQTKRDNSRQTINWTTKKDIKGQINNYQGTKKQRCSM